jgi:hypothetical protein
VRGRFHAGDIDLFQLGHVTEDGAELVAELLLFLRRQFDARKLGHVVDVEVRHGREGSDFRNRAQAG